MAHWQIFNKAGVAQPDQFDDGLDFMPGEDGFSTEAVEAHAASLGKGCTYSMIGVPGWHTRVEREAIARGEAEQAQARRDAATAEIDRMLAPEPTQADLINVRFDELLAAAPDRAKDIKKLRKAELDALETAPA
jgi:hypothetical protein